jgi:hypothetical protein
VLTLALFGAVPCRAAGARVPTPADALLVAARDAAAHPAEASTYGYLSLHWVPEKDWELWRGRLSFHTNGLSSEPEITPPTLLVSDLPGAGKVAVLRIDRTAYGKTFQRAWDRLGPANYVFDVTLVPSVVQVREVQKARPTREYNGYVWGWDGEWDTERNEWKESGHWVRLYDPYGRRTLSDYVTVRVKGDSGENKTALAPWLSETPEAKAALASLVKLTQTTVPVVDGPWFLWQTAAQEDRGDTGYGDFLGFSTEDEYFRLIGFDARLLKNFPLEAAEAIDLSSVTEGQKPRAITAFGKIAGRLYKTLDVNAPVQRANPLEVVDPINNLDAAAFEELGQLPNGLWAAGLFDARQRKRQDFAPQRNAFNRHGRHNDYNVHLGTFTCLYCHETKAKGVEAAGLNDLDSYFRGVLELNPFQFNATLTSRDKEERLRLRRLYYSDVNGWIAQDRAGVAAAMIKCNGWEPSVTVTEYNAAYWDVDGPVDSLRAAAQLGVTQEQMISGFDHYLQSTGALDPVLAAYLAPDKVEGARRGLKALAKGRKVHFKVWMATYALAQYTVRGIVVPPQVEVIK